jgi:hypothetical protein
MRFVQGRAIWFAAQRIDLLVLWRRTRNFTSGVGRAIVHNYKDMHDLLRFPLND